MSQAAKNDHLPYRPDIDGLRGLAVLAVVAFHAFPDSMKSGFIGVDVFFVISGFLITSVILRDAGSEEGFSFRRFYARRARRIFPALAVVLASSLAIGWFILNRAEYRALGIHAVGGASFVSNFLLWSESGYFDIEAERKPLLHLWSLAIEEQFYLLFPLSAWIVWKWRKRWLAPAILFAALASFAWNLRHAPYAAENYFSTATRAWELMIGAALACAAPRLAALGRESKNLLSIAGLVLLCTGFILVRKEDPFPSWRAIFPTLGAAGLIAGSADAWLARHVFANRALVGVGLISYPLYLWHWPLLSFGHVSAAGTAAPAYRIALALLALGLAWLTWRYVEVPVRSGKRAPTALAASCLALVLAGVLGVVVVGGDGFGGRNIARRLESYLRTAVMTHEGCVEVLPSHRQCRLGPPSAAPLVLAYGDSHALAMRPALDRIGHEMGIGIVLHHVGACSPFLGVYAEGGWQAPADPCRGFAERTFEYAKENRIPTVLIFFANPDPGLAVDPILRDGIRRTVEAYRGIGTRVHLAVDYPLQRLSPEDALRRSDGTDGSINAFAVTWEENEAHQRAMRELLLSFGDDHVSILDFTGAYCPDEACPLVQDGAFLYADDDHLSVSGAMLAYPDLKESLVER